MNPIYLFVHLRYPQESEDSMTAPIRKASRGSLCSQSASQAPLGAAAQPLEKAPPPAGELKLLTYSAFEHLSALHLFSECPNTCLMVIYFR